MLCRFRSDEHEALLRADFVSFAAHCFREFNARTPIRTGLALRGHCGEIGSGQRRPDAATDHQYAAAPALSG
jgi:hypothetical protein